MDFYTFIKTYNTEQKCILLWKKFRDKHGVFCNRCGHDDHYWLSSRHRYRCKHCNWETSLRSGTLLEYSKLPYRYWVYAIGALAYQMKSISALQMQRNLGHRYYRPIWLMMQKLKVMMSDRVDWYAMLDHLVAGTSEFPAIGDKAEEDSGAISPKKLPDKNRNSALNAADRGQLEPVSVELRGLNLLMPEVHPWHKRAQGGRLRLISMCPKALNQETNNHHHPVSRQSTPKHRGQLPGGMNIRIRSIDRRPRPWFENDADKGKLGFTEIMVVNAKRSLVGIHHHVSKRYLRNYLGEYCYLTNRRYSGEEKIEQMFGLFVSKPWNLPYIVHASD